MARLRVRGLLQEERSVRPVGRRSLRCRRNSPIDVQARLPCDVALGTGSCVASWAPSLTCWVALSRHPHSCASVSPVFEQRQLVPDHHSVSLPRRDSVDSDQFKREEDFYYTEVQMKEEAAAAGTSTADSAPTPGVTSSPLAILPPPPPKGQPSGPEHPGLESYLPSGALSKSAPGSFWHIQADHAYQVWLGTLGA